MRQVYLKAKSIRGEIRINKSGHIWNIVQEKNRVLFSRMFGPWWLLFSITNESIRWVHSINDEDFFVEKCQN